MAKSTAPLLIIGGVTITSRWLESLEIDLKYPEIPTPDFFTTDKFWKPAVATGLTVGAFALLEKVNQPLTVGVAWVALVTVLFVPQTGLLGLPRMNIFDRIADLQKNPRNYINM